MNFFVGLKFKKITDVLIPFLAYFVLSVIVQCAVTLFVIRTGIFESTDAENVNTLFTYNFLDLVNETVTSYTLTVSLITSGCGVIMAYIFMVLDNNVVKELHPNLSGILFLLPFGIITSLALGRFVSILPIDGLLGNYRAFENVVVDSEPVVVLFSLIIVGPIFEELLFRGVIYNRLRTDFDPLISAYISGILFGIYHMNLIQGIYATLCGIILGVVYEYYGSVLAPILFHIFMNATTVLTMDNPVSKFLDKHIFFSIIVMLLEMAVFILILAVFINKTGIHRAKKYKQKEKPKKPKFEVRV